MNLYHGDCLEVLPTLEEDSIDACVTDPPYELGFMGKGWDRTGIANNVAMWREVFRVLKPGAHLLAFGGTRTYHRMACAIEDAGFEIRDQIGWLYGSGFPKSHDISKAIDKMAGAKRDVIGVKTYADGTAGHWGLSDKYAQDAHTKSLHGAVPKLETTPATDAAKQWQGWGTALKPAWEPICVARKPLSEKTVAENVLAHGVGAINVDACRVVAASDDYNHSGNANTANRHNGRENWRFTQVQQPPSPLGRWPANIAHDGSDEVLAAFPIAPGQMGRARTDGVDQGNNTYGALKHITSAPEPRGDTGTAARFFYCAKASKADRSGSRHPTVKPVALMRWLVRLVTPPGGIVLDPFAGSGTTGAACVAEGFRAVLIEREDEYVADIRSRAAVT